MMHTNKVIVTGGEGFIGSHLVDRLVDMNYDVHVIDNESAESNDMFYKNEKARHYNLDIVHINETHNWLFRDCFCIFHLAAESRIIPAIENPLKAAHVNVIGTVNLLEKARQFNISKFIYSSTSSVYGLNCSLPTNEDSPIDCLNPYSATKYAGEEMIRMYSKLFGLDSCIFRYFNVFGERAPTKGSYAPVIGLFQKMKAENKPLSIVGSGNQRRDFIHVDDVVSANISAMLSDKKLYDKPINIGSGINFSINEIASLISDNIEYLPARMGEAEHTLADISRAKQMLNFASTIEIDKWILKHANQ